MVDQLKGWVFIVLGLCLLVVPFLNSSVEGWWLRLLQVVGASVVARFLYRWARARYEAAPGLRGFVPHKTPWAP
jgi:NhaP-type Na+/H+ or K+/H+ antiporter